MANPMANPETVDGVFSSRRFSQIDKNFSRRENNEDFSRLETDGEELERMRKLLNMANDVEKKMPIQAEKTIDNDWLDGLDENTMDTPVPEDVKVIIDWERDDSSKRWAKATEKKYKKKVRTYNNVKTKLGNALEIPEKRIIVQWVRDNGTYGIEMRVIRSDHERFVVGSRFDYGFFGIATNEGYAIMSLPLKK